MLNVGLVGFGYAGRTLHAPLIRATPGLRLAAVASRDAATVHAALGAEVVVHGSAETMIDDAPLDLIVLASPNATHAPLARRALQAGRHVVIDKPMALDATEAAPLLPLAREAARVLSVFHNRRFDGDFLTAQALLAAGTLGRITEARLHFDRFRPQVRARWRESGEAGGGLWADLSPHLLDQALQLFGEPIGLSADLMRLRDGAASDDAFECRLRFAGGLRVTLAASMLAALPGPRFALHGTRGSWMSWPLDPQEDALKAGMAPEALPPAAGELCVAGADGGEPQCRPWPTQPGRWRDYYGLMRDAMLGLGPNPVPPEQACRVLALQDLGRAADAARRELPC
nr:oxidoreductase [Aquabacterium terrae]